MPNNYFQFKDFTVHQGNCAMKVTTDACLFGAITAIQLLEPAQKYVLDIGSGTGLLSLMLAQQNPKLLIDAVEIDLAAVEESRKNVAESKYAAAINIHHTDICDYVAQHYYDLVVTNPPFYENDLKSNSNQRNKALHDATLTLNILMEQIDRLVKPTGAFSILLPYQRAAYFTAVAAALQWNINSRIDLKQTEEHTSFRSILYFKKADASIKPHKTIIIKEKDAYTEAFIQFLKAYYLHL